MGSIIFFFVLLANSVCILNQDRFLLNFDLKYDRDNRSSSTLKGTLAALIYKVQTLFTWPLIILNIISIIFQIY